MVTKEILNQYSSLLEEREEVQNQIFVLENKISNLKDRISEIENGEMVKDKVRGGDGGYQTYVIEGIPTREYQNKKTEIQTKMLLLGQRKNTLEELNHKIEAGINDVEVFIVQLDDSYIRRIVRYKFIENLSWLKVAKKLGGGNTENGVKSAFHRFMKNN